MSTAISLKTDKTKKFQAVDINKLYHGSAPKNQYRALPPKQGLQSLGKLLPARRAPVNLPSLKSENFGNDPAINLVPTGGTGWAGSNVNSTNAPTSNSTGNAGVKSQKEDSKNTESRQKEDSGSTGRSEPRTWGTVTSAGLGKSNFLNQQSPLFGQEFPSLTDDKSKGSENSSVSTSETKYGPGPNLRPQTFVSNGGWKGPSTSSSASAIADKPKPNEVGGNFSSVVPGVIGDAMDLESRRSFILGNNFDGIFGNRPKPKPIPHTNHLPSPRIGHKMFQTSIIDNEKLKCMDELESNNDDDWAKADETFDYNKNLESDEDEDEPAAPQMLPAKSKPVIASGNWTASEPSVIKPVIENSVPIEPRISSTSIPTKFVVDQASENSSFFDDEEQKRLKKNEEVQRNVERARKLRAEQEQKFKSGFFENRDYKINNSASLPVSSDNNSKFEPNGVFSSSEEDKIPVVSSKPSRFKRPIAETKETKQQTSLTEEIIQPPAALASKNKDYGSFFREKKESPEPVQDSKPPIDNPWFDPAKKEKELNIPEPNKKAKENDKKQQQNSQKQSKNQHNYVNSNGGRSGKSESRSTKSSSNRGGRGSNLKSSNNNGNNFPYQGQQSRGGSRTARGGKSRRDDQNNEDSRHNDDSWFAPRGQPTRRGRGGGSRNHNKFSEEDNKHEEKWGDSNSENSDKDIPSRGKKLPTKERHEEIDENRRKFGHKGPNKSGNNQASFGRGSQPKIAPRFAKQNRNKYRSEWNDNNGGHVWGNEDSNGQSEIKTGGQSNNNLSSFSQTKIFKNTVLKGNKSFRVGDNESSSNGGGLGFSHTKGGEDSADLKLDFAFEASEMEVEKSDASPRGNHPSTEDLNLKIASCKKVWEPIMSSSDSFAPGFPEEGESTDGKPAKNLSTQPPNQPPPPQIQHQAPPPPIQQQQAPVQSPQQMHHAHPQQQEPPFNRMVPAMTSPSMHHSVYQTFPMADTRSPIYSPYSIGVHTAVDMFNNSQFRAGTAGFNPNSGPAGNVLLSQGSGLLKQQPSTVSQIGPIGTKAGSFQQSGIPSSPMLIYDSFMPRSAGPGTGQTAFYPPVPSPNPQRPQQPPTFNIPGFPNQQLAATHQQQQFRNQPHVSYMQQQKSVHQGTHLDKDIKIPFAVSKGMANMNLRGSNNYPTPIQRPIVATSGNIKMTDELQNSDHESKKNPDTADGSQ